MSESKLSHLRMLEVLKSLSHEPHDNLNDNIYFVFRVWAIKLLVMSVIFAHLWQFGNVIIQIIKADQNLDLHLCWFLLMFVLRLESTSVWLCAFPFCCISRSRMIWKSFGIVGCRSESHTAVYIFVHILDCSSRLVTCEKAVRCVP